MIEDGPVATSELYECGCHYRAVERRVKSNKREAGEKEAQRTKNCLTGPEVGRYEHIHPHDSNEFSACFSASSPFYKAANLIPIFAQIGGINSS
jgi:hypothetical protein